MSATPFAKASRELREAVAGAAWSQWTALGAPAAADEPRSIVDPEALVLVSLWLREEEPRFWDLLSGFARTGSRLLSVQRMRRLVGRFPAGTPERLGWFAEVVSRASRDPRWRGLARADGAPRDRGSKVVEPARRLGQPGALLLRLRTAFGVDVRVDALAFLLGQAGRPETTARIAQALGYAVNTVRGGLMALVDARFVTAEGGRPERYRAGAERWGDLLGLKTMPSWHPWWQAYATALDLLRWMEQSDVPRASPQVARMLAREWMREHRGALSSLGLDLPDQRDHPGEAYGEVFAVTLEGFVRWFREST